MIGLEERLGLFQEIREKIDPTEEEQNTQRLQACFWNILLDCGAVVGEVSSLRNSGSFWHLLLSPAPSSPALESQHTHEAAWFLQLFTQKHAPGPLLSHGLGLSEPHHWWLAFLFPPHSPTPLLPLGEAFVQYPLSERIHCCSLVPVNFFPGTSCK